MEEKKAGQRLTLEEMFDIFEQDVYKEYREQHGILIEQDNNGRRYTNQYPPFWYTDLDVALIHKYILAYQVLNRPHEGEGSPAWLSPDTYSHEFNLALAFFLLHPLVWASAEEYHNAAIIGHLAVNVYDETMVNEVRNFLHGVENMRILYYADNYENVIPADFPEYGYYKGMHVWSPLTDNAERLYDEIISGNAVDYKEIYTVKRFDAECLRRRIVYIAEMRSKERAAKIIRLLQNEWPKLKVWKNTLPNMSKEDIDDFENCLNYGFDDLLAEWESNEKCFPLLTEKCRREHKVQEVEQALQEAYSGTAKTLWEKIKSLIRDGYFKDEDAMTIYREWEAYFGKMKYTDRNFRDARNKA